MKKKRGMKKISVSFIIVIILQVFLLVNLPISHGFILNSVFSGVSADSDGSSSGSASYCCPETEEGAICQTLPQDDKDKCAVTAQPTSCDNLNQCQIGCCIDPEEGLCSTKSSKQKCESDGGNWVDSPNCLTKECQKACCVLGDEVQFVEEKRCEKLANDKGLEKDFRRNYDTEPQCLALGANQTEGACVLQGGCIRTTGKDCAGKGGDFYEGMLCTAESLNTSCNKTKETKCVEGEDEVYYLDSCGNLANIYDSSRYDGQSYWNEIVSKQEACGSGSGNINSETCGNCNRYVGSTCADAENTSGKSVEPEHGDKYCKNLNCPDAPDVVNAKGEVLERKDRKNGESWCVYDSQIGKGLDTVGSRHWKYSCQNGEVETGGCADYRGQICVESTMEEDDESFTQASCMVNEWRSCQSYNRFAEKKGDSVDYSKVRKKCKENSACYLKEMNFGEGYHIFQCLPKYPPGLNLKGSKEKQKRNSKICNQANFKCKKIEVKEIDGWDCVAGCECDTKMYTREMNEWCKSLGDCGGDVNILGDKDKAYTTNGPDPEVSKYVENIKPEKDKSINPKNLSAIAREIMGERGGKKGQPEKRLAESEKFGNKFSMYLGTVSGALGTGFSALAGTVLPATTTEVVGITYQYGRAFAQMRQVPSFWSNAGSAFSGAALGAAAGAAASHLAVKLTGAQGQAAMAATVAGVAAGAVAGGVAAATGASSTAGSVVGFGTSAASAAGMGSLSGMAMTAGLAFAWAFIVALVIAGLMKAFGIGDTKETTYRFKCHPWQPQTEDQKCSACNENDDLKPCTEYRCNSLGAACHLINKDSENPECVKTPNDGTPPEISPGSVRKNYSFTDEKDDSVKIKPDNGKCIPEFTEVNFSLETNEHAQCKMAFQRTSKFEEMEQYFGGSNLFLEEHENSIFMPSLSSIKVHNVTGNIKKKYGDMDMFVRCQDVNGNKNVKEYSVKFCVESGPDETPPRIRKFMPSDESYLKYGENSTILNIFLNEPAECRYSLVEDEEGNKEYEEMENSMNCSTGLQDSLGQGWPCSTNLTNLQGRKSPVKYNIKCKDQPWYKNTKNSSKRNANTERFDYTLKKTESQLNITSISPSPGSEIEAGYVPFPVDLSVKTSGGVNNGKAACQYKFTENGTYMGFSETGSTEHEQNFDKIMSEEYEIFVRCQDIAGNTAKNKTSFSLDIDESPPQITRVFQEGGDLKIMTDEKGECAYSYERCDFQFTTNNSMTTAFSKQHSTNWEEDKKYYIKCKDVWENENSGCAMIIRPGML